MGTEVKVELQATDILQMINSLISAAADLYASLEQVRGNQDVPTWQEISDLNAILQSKIDAEKD